MNLRKTGPGRFSFPPPPLPYPPTLFSPYPSLPLSPPSCSLLPFPFPSRLSVTSSSPTPFFSLPPIPPYNFFPLPPSPLSPPLPPSFPLFLTRRITFRDLFCRPADLFFTPTPLLNKLVNLHNCPLLPRPQISFSLPYRGLGGPGGPRNCTTAVCETPPIRMASSYPQPAKSLPFPL